MPSILARAATEGETAPTLHRLGYNVQDYIFAHCVRSMFKIFLLRDYKKQLHVQYY